MADAVLGIIGGSGIYDLPGLENSEWISVDSPWGTPSDQVRIGSINGLKIVFLPRHGRGHVYSPTSINYRANIDVMKRCGVTDLLSVSACGSLKEEHAPGTFVLVDQFIDRTIAREKSFFGTGCVAHVSMATPVSPSWSTRSPRRRRPRASPMPGEAPTWRWKAPSSRPSPKAISTGPGAVT